MPVEIIHGCDLPNPDLSKHNGKPVFLNGVVVGVTRNARRVDTTTADNARYRTYSIVVDVEYLPWYAELIDPVKKSVGLTDADTPLVVTHQER